jgi:hypothetical protein
MPCWRHPCWGVTRWRHPGVTRWEVHSWTAPARGWWHQATTAAVAVPLPQQVVQGRRQQQQQEGR